MTNIVWDFHWEKKYICISKMGSFLHQNIRTLIHLIKHEETSPKCFDQPLFLDFSSAKMLGFRIWIMVGLGLSKVNEPMKLHRKNDEKH